VEPGRVLEALRLIGVPADGPEPVGAVPVAGGVVR
jgi:hypothetical protein